ncbi:MAG TPA: hypothetical protein VHU84_02340 [Lacipirellulaceae bacterium]|nr:hypothetical protein [Lacipirellulaceae bacterium]
MCTGLCGGPDLRGSAGKLAVWSDVRTVAVRGTLLDMRAVADFSASRDRHAAVCGPADDANDVTATSTTDVLPCPCGCKLLQCRGTELRLWRSSQLWR